MKIKCIPVGGQALIEGILMRGPAKCVLAVRRPDGDITTEDFERRSLSDKYGVFKIPVLRGVVAFIESLIMGYRALMRSADLSGMTDLEEEGEETTPEKKKKNDTLMSVVMTIASILGVALAIFLFMWLPALLFNLINNAAGGTMTVYRSVFEGVIKLLLFLGYITAVSLMKDIKRVFMYHGAEHKTIFCFESGLPLTVENARKMRRFHPRCGTSFMFLMIFVSIIINGFVSLIPGITNLLIIWVLVKLLMVPLVCGVGYELLRICGRYQNALTKIIAAPGLWVQRLTTKEPEDDMLEVAIVSLKAVLPDAEKGAEAETPDE